MKTFHKILFAATMAIVANAALAQTTVKGVVIDSLSKEGVPFATVAVNKPGDQTNFAMTGITDLDGAFSGTVKAKGQYIMTIRSTGKEPIVLPINVKGEKILDLGTIKMRDAIDTLGTVEVVAQKALVSAEAGKIKYNAEGDPDNKTSTVLDMLRKVPMVTVDGEDNISINGNSSFVVYMNGRKNTMLTDNPTEMLKAMPASSVKNIEVITDPGAKFDAEGAGGIINLITDTQAKLNQVSGNVSLNVSTRNKGAGAGISVQQGKFAASLRVNASENNTDMEMRSEQIQELAATDALKSRTTTEMQNDGKARFGNLALEASYEIDKSNLVALSGGATLFDRDGDATSAITTALNGAEFVNRMISETDNKFKSYNLGVDFQHLFGGNAEKTLTLSYKLWGNAGDNNSLSVNPDVLAINDFGVDYSGRKTHNKTGSSEHTFQLDYTAPLNKTLTLDAGGKYIYRPKKSEGYTYIGSDATPSQTVDYTNNDNIGALYTQLAVKMSQKTSLRGGIRYEYTAQNIDYKDDNGKDFSIDYSTWVPSATFNYAIAPTQNLSLTYNMRISRPNERQLNPYRDESGITSVSYGNPNLDVQKYHNFGISYGYFSMKQNINLSLRYNTCNNEITEWSFYDGDILNNTYVNATENSTFSGNIYYSIQISKNARFFTNSSLNYSNMDNPISKASNDGWSANLYGNFQYTTPFKLKISAGAMLSTKRYNINGYSKGMNIGMLSLEKSFLKDKLTLSASAVLDLKHGYHLHMDTHSAGVGYESNTSNQISIGRVGVSLSYRFGKQVQVKRTKSTINNDDFERTEQSGDDTPRM